MLVQLMMVHNSFARNIASLSPVLQSFFFFPVVMSTQGHIFWFPQNVYYIQEEVLKNAKSKTSNKYNTGRLMINFDTAI